MERSYVYTILRYVHDLETAEFINVGVVVAWCDEPRVVAKFTTSYGRVKGAFPSLDVDVFTARMKRLQACFNAVNVERCADIRVCAGSSIFALIRSILPLEDSALRWSPVGSGIGASIEASLQFTYERYVSRHDFQRRR